MGELPFPTFRERERFFELRSLILPAYEAIAKSQDGLAQPSIWSLDISEQQ